MSVTFAPIATITPHIPSGNVKPIGYSVEWDWADAAVNVVMDDGSVTEPNDSGFPLVAEFYERTCAYLDREIAEHGTA